MRKREYADDEEMPLGTVEVHSMARRQLTASVIVASSSPPLSG
jgi:hypothetical protein